MDQAMGYQHFSTRGLASLQRIELWEQHNAATLLPLAVRSIDGSVLEATEEHVRLPRLTFARISANPHIVERTADHIASTATDGVALYFSLAGDAFFYHQDGVQLQRPGTLLVCDVTQPFLRGFAHGLQEFVLTVPRGVFEEVTEGGLPREPIVKSFADVAGGDRHAAALGQLIHRTLLDPTNDSLAATEASAVELLRTMFSPAGERSSAAYRHAALAWIQRHLRDPSLSVTRVAEAVGVSERHLSRVFSEAGPGVARTILELRLELAHRMLSGVDAPGVQVVARRCGFGSAAHFSRVFRERYELRPVEVRGAARRVTVSDIG